MGIDHNKIEAAMTIQLDWNELPPPVQFDEQYRRAPKRDLTLNKSEIDLALANALRYIHPRWH